MPHTSFDHRDLRHAASHRYRPLLRQNGYDHETARDHERDTLIRMALKPGDWVLYDFGAHEANALTVQSVTPHHILAVDSQDRTYSFGGVDAPCPGKWDADPVTVTTRLIKAKIQPCDDAGTICAGECL